MMAAVKARDWPRSSDGSSVRLKPGRLRVRLPQWPLILQESIPRWYVGNAVPALTRMLFREVVGSIPTLGA